MSTGTADLQRFLADRCVELEAEGSVEGETLAGGLTVLRARVIALKIAIISTAPLPGWMRRALLIRIAYRHWPNQYEEMT